mmetsp:Transcript_43101/g.133184  ORF Transcript_43101/g.133184 Transcript_43101/m.133184 type:complete len:204 (-) Transcript_43101:1080-1691(-)
MSNSSPFTLALVSVSKYAMSTAHDVASPSSSVATGVSFSCRSSRRSESSAPGAPTSSAGLVGVGRTTCTSARGASSPFCVAKNSSTSLANVSKSTLNCCVVTKKCRHSGCTAHASVTSAKKFCSRGSPRYVSIRFRRSLNTRPLCASSAPDSSSATFASSSDHGDTHCAIRVSTVGTSSAVSGAAAASSRSASRNADGTVSDE